jgi:hypothetical protein
MNSNQLNDLLKRISTDHKLKRTEDTSLLSEERYPVDLSPLFENLTKPTSLQDAISLLRWNRTKSGNFVDKSSYEHAKTEQNNLRKALQLIPDTDCPWEKVHYQDWKDKITVICLSAVQKVAMIGINHKDPLSWIYTPKLVDPAKTVRNHDDNIEGLQYLHPLLLDSPWGEPANLNDLLLDLIQEKDPVVYAQAISKDQAERIKANVAAIKQALRRIYKLNTDTFHAFLIDLIPRARDNKSHLFTRIKAEREQHLVHQRVYKKAKGSPTALTQRQAKAHSALHTLEFIEQHYVKENENSVHILWTQILLHTREPMTNVYNWTVSFELPARRITQCQRSALKKDHALRIRTLIANKQMTDAEKLTITTIDTSLTADLIDSGTYKLDVLKTLLATHIARFEAAYSPTSSVRIMRYLRTRARDFKVDPQSFSKTKGKGKTTSPSKRIRPIPQRVWRGAKQHLQSSMSCTNQYCVHMNIAHTHSIEDCKNKYPRFGSPGKGKGSGSQGKGKDGKGRGKGSKGGKGMGKGKGKGKSKEHTHGLGLQLPLHTSTSSTASSAGKTNTNLADVTCYFPKWLALRSSSAYQHTRQQAPRLGLILDHLEDAVFAPDSCCLWCADSTCDGTNCASTFDPNDFQEATTLFMQQLKPLVANSKLDRPLDSHPPLSRELMLTRLETDDWGDMYMYEGTQDDYQDQDYWQEQHQQEHEHTEQNHELQYQDSNEEAHGYEEEMVEHDHTQEGAAPFESEDEHQDE